MPVCVLGSGSVAQGAFHELSRMSLRPRMFYRKTLPIFWDTIDQYGIIVNGIEVDTPGTHIISESQLDRINERALIIDAAADARNAVWGTEYQSLAKPVGVISGRQYVLVNNAPAIMPTEASSVISRVVAEEILPAVASNRDLFI